MDKHKEYAHMAFGCKKQGQSVIFKIKYSSVEDDLFKKLKTITHWQDSFTTKKTTLNKFNTPVVVTYYWIVGSFHIDKKKTFRVITQYFLNERNLKIAQMNQMISHSNYGELLMIEEYETRQQDYDNMYSLDSF